MAEILHISYENIGKSTLNEANFLQAYIKKKMIKSADLVQLYKRKLRN